MNAVVLSVCLMLGLSLVRVNVVIALTLSAIVGGLSAGLGLQATVDAFQNGLGGGATIALGYVMLGAFAVALSQSGLTTWLAQHLLRRLDVAETPASMNTVRYGLLGAVLLMAVASQNILPIHIAFIPMLIPPLLHLMGKLRLDRRLVACVLTGGLVTTYMMLPVGFGSIFLLDILHGNLVQNGLEVAKSQMAPAMLLPGAGMLLGLAAAVYRFRKPRDYKDAQTLRVEPETEAPTTKNLIVALLAVCGSLGVQLATGSMIMGALIGLAVFTLGKVVRADETQQIFSGGVRMMAMIGFIMIAAAGFAAVMRETGQVETLVTALSGALGDSQPLAALVMLVVGLLITMGIGSSFSTIPIIATLYVPLGLELGFSPLAITALVGTAAALGDAGSPASDSTLGPTSGLNADGQHDHIWDTVVPTFVHFNLPLIAFGWLAAMVL